MHQRVSGDGKYMTHVKKVWTYRNGHYSEKTKCPIIAVGGVRDLRPGPTMANQLQQVGRDVLKGRFRGGMCFSLEFSFKTLISHGVVIALQSSGIVGFNLFFKGQQELSGGINISYHTILFSIGNRKGRHHMCNRMT